MKFGDLVDVELDGRLEYRKHMPADVKDGFPMIFLGWHQDVRGIRHLRFFLHEMETNAISTASSTCV